MMNNRDFGSVRGLLAIGYDLIARGGSGERARMMLAGPGCYPSRRADIQHPGAGHRRR